MPLIKRQASCVVEGLLSRPSIPDMSDSCRDFVQENREENGISSISSVCETNVLFACTHIPLNNVMSDTIDLCVLDCLAC